MELHQIRYFLAVSETLNFTRAAEDCNVAQPSLSRAIRKLEEELGGPLLRRERGHTHLTELGRTMKPLLQQCFDAASAAKLRARALGVSEAVPLRIGLSHTIDIGLMDSALAEIARVAPAFSLDVRRGTADDILQALKDGELELALVGAPEADWERFERWTLFEEGFASVGGEDLASAGGEIRLDDLASPQVFDRPYCEMQPAFVDALRERGFEWSASHRVGDDGDAIALARSGLGVAIMPESTLRLRSTSGRPLAEPALRRTVRLIGAVGRRRSAAAATLVKMLRARDWSADPR